MKQFLTLCAFCVLFIATGCDDDTSGPSTQTPWTASTQNFNVTAWQDNAVYFDSTSISSLKNADTVSHTYVFEGADAKAKTLAPGKIIIIHGKALRKVATTSNQGGNIVVTTQPATINEAIKNGTIEWDKGIDFTNPIIPVAVSKKGEELPLRAVGKDSFEIKMKAGDYDCVLTMKMRGEDAYVKIEAEKTAAKVLKGKLVFEGTLKRFRSKAKIVYIDGKAVEVGLTNDQLNGEMVISLTAAGSGMDVLKVFEFPAVLLKYPFLIGPIPATLNVKAKFVISGQVPYDGSSQVEAKFAYNSQTGFRYAGNKVEVNATIGNYKIEKNKAQTGASSPVGLNFGVSFPLIEISMLAESIVPSMQTDFLLGGFYQPGVKPCQLAIASYNASVGYNLSIFGVIELAKGSKELWKRNDTLLKAGNCY